MNIDKQLEAPVGGSLRMIEVYAEKIRKSQRQQDYKEFMEMLESEKIRDDEKDVSGSVMAHAQDKVTRNHLRKELKSKLKEWKDK